MKFWNQADPHRREDLADKDLDQFIFEFQTTGVKLAGALNGMARGLGSSDAAFTVACLKRAGSPAQITGGPRGGGAEATAARNDGGGSATGLVRDSGGDPALMDEFRGR